MLSLKIWCQVWVKERICLFEYSLSIKWYSYRNNSFTDKPQWFKSLEQNKTTSILTGETYSEDDQVASSQRTHIIETLFQFGQSVLSHSLRPHGLQHTKLPYPSPTPRACSNSCLFNYKQKVKGFLLQIYSKTSLITLSIEILFDYHVKYVKTRRFFCTFQNNAKSNIDQQYAF